MERTLVFFKKDAIERKLVGEIIATFEKAGLKIIAMKMIKVNRKLAEKQYPKTEEQIVGMGNKTLKAVRESGRYDEVKEIFKTEDARKIGLILRRWMIEYLLSSPTIAMILEGKNAVELVRKIVGYTDPIKAEKGTIRGDFAADSIAQANSEGRAVKNLVHASGSKEEAEREIKLWFQSKEIF